MTPLGPIVFVDDDQRFYKNIFQQIAPRHPVLLFTSGQQTLDYLRATADKPFLIVSEVRFNEESGLELRRQIEADQQLRKRAIPFIFLTHPVYRRLVDEAYEITVQGLFEKTGSVEDTHRQLSTIINYWMDCIHPNKLEKTQY